MSRMLNLVDHLRNRGRNFQSLGRDRDACLAWKQLARFRDLPVALQEETQANLAELRLKRRQFQRARRHLAAALLYQPASARYHYLMAQALNTLDRGDPDRAAEHYRRSLELDPNQPRCRAEFGLLLVDLGDPDEGVAELQRAVEQGADDPQVLGQVVEGLCLAERPDEARQVLRAARFRNPRDSRLVKLWNDLQYDQLVEAQASAREDRPRPVGDAEPTLLPFIRPAEHQVRLRVRRDPPQPLPAPHRPRRCAQTRHAQQGRQ
jgi:Tfp pilus assembly protein PilF